MMLGHYHPWYIRTHTHTSVSCRFEKCEEVWGEQGEGGLHIQRVMTRRLFYFFPSSPAFIVFQWISVRVMMALLCIIALAEKDEFCWPTTIDQITVGHPWCACALHECSLDERQSSTCEAAYRRSRNDIVLKKKNRYTPSNRFLSPLTPPSISPFSLCGLALYKYATATIMLPYKYMHTWISSKGTFLFLCSSFFPSLSHTRTFALIYW